MSLRPLLMMRRRGLTGSVVSLPAGNKRFMSMSVGRFVGGNSNGDEGEALAATNDNYTILSGLGDLIEVSTAIGVLNNDSHG